jgi:hypothetical protein
MGYIEFMALRNVGFIINLYDWKPNFPNNVQRKPPTPNFHQACETVYEVQRKNPSIVLCKLWFIMD